MVGRDVDEKVVLLESDADEALFSLMSRMQMPKMRMGVVSLEPNFFGLLVGENAPGASLVTASLSDFLKLLHFNLISCLTSFVACHISWPSWMVL
jgi:hypothetical protein